MSNQPSFRYAIFTLLTFLQLTSCSVVDFRPGDTVKDRDWNTRFLSNCPMPQRDSVRWVEEDRRYLRFTLLDKDKGGCSTDKIARHSAPYWERAELKQLGTLKKNKTYTIDATLRLVEGFSGSREAFFQVHAYDKRCKKAYPPVMIGFDNEFTDTAVLALRALQSNKRHSIYRSDIHIEDVLGKWVDLKLILDTTGDEANITMLVDQKELFSNIPIWVESCGVLHLKFGLYRPGDLSGNDRSIVDFDSINVN